MKYFVLSLIVLGAASMNGQVRIGGDANPHSSAILDLNAADNADNAVKGLALPRVNGTASVTSPVKGLFVYNTVDNMIYYYSGSAWVKIENTTYTADGSTLSLSGTTFSVKDAGVVKAKIAADAVDSTKVAAGALSGSDLADNAITTAKIRNLNVTTDKLNNNAVTVAKLPAGATSTTFLRGDGTWVVPTNTTYAAPAAGGLTLSGTNFSVNTAVIPSGTWLYCPPFVLPWTSGATNQTVNLFDKYTASQSFASAPKSTGAPNAVANRVTTATDFYYVVASYPASLSNISVSTAGVMTYNCTTTAPTASDFITIILIKK
jgi:hypothetical protein